MFSYKISQAGHDVPPFWFRHFKDHTMTGPFHFSETPN
jgi:hypothetical protein